MRLRVLERFDMPGIDSSAPENRSGALLVFLIANSWRMLVPCFTDPKSY